MARPPVPSRERERAVFPCRHPLDCFHVSQTVFSHHRRRAGRGRRAGSNSEAGGQPQGQPQTRHAARRQRRHPESDGGVGSELHLRPTALRQVGPELVGGIAHAPPGARGIVRPQAGGPAAAAQLRVHYPVREPRHHAGQKPGARPRDRQHLPDDPQRIPGRHPAAEIQHVDSRGGADGIHHRPWRRHLQRVQLRKSGQPRHARPKPAR